jgi:SAM-dependent methyltransferase/uncharacterized protein YbaR (Trm112 family)
VASPTGTSGSDAADSRPVNASSSRLPQWAIEVLACPIHRSPLTDVGGELGCVHGERFPIVDGIPILLRRDVRQTHPAALDSLSPNGLHAVAAEAGTAVVDRFVQREILKTNGYMYRSLVGGLSGYPIPRLRITPARTADLLLDVGCNWGRWSVSAARAGFRPIGVDPSLEAIRAACRVAAQLGIDAAFLVADARFLPFKPDAFDVVFSYSVWQHFDKEDTVAAMSEAARVLKPRGRASVQMANACGVRSLYHQARRGFRRARGFEVRYWRPAELKRTFADRVGDASLSADGFFSLNPQAADVELLPRRFRWIVHVSDWLRTASLRLPWLVGLADSLCVTATKPGDSAAAEAVRAIHPNPCP